MESQQEAFERFKSSGSGHGSGRGGRSYEGASSNRRGDDGPLPDLYSIHKGKVVRVEDFGAFVQIPGFRRHGLVHKTQASRHFTEKISDVVAVDPNLVQLTGAEDKRRTHTGFIDKGPISIEQGGVFLKTVCSKCGASGHLATECFSSGEKFELLADDGDDDVYGENKSHKDRHSRDEDKSRDKERDRHHDHHRESSNRRDHKDKKESSSRRKEKRHDRSRSRRNSAGPDKEVAMTVKRILERTVRGQGDLSHEQEDLSDQNVVDGGLGLDLYLAHDLGRGRLVEDNKDHDDC
ncbi:Nucleolar protein of 40 kDa [Linnemannia zychae]|nr:Nucleolar protein of 40 kDa [Linnemannia zychae]